MAANMDGVGTIEMANELESAGMFTCLKKTYNESTLIEYFNNKIRKYTAMSIGITERDYRKLVDVHEVCHGNLLFVCIDVAMDIVNALLSLSNKLVKNFLHLQSLLEMLSLVK